MKACGKPNKRAKTRFPNSMLIKGLVAEEFSVQEHMKPAILKFLDPNQYGIVFKSSTTHAVIYMVHISGKGIDGNGRHC